MKKYLIPLFFLAVFSCQSTDKPVSNSGEGSYVQTKLGESVVVKNHYFESRPNGSIFEINSLEFIGDSSKLPKFEISPVYPKADSGTWTIKTEANSFSFDKQAILFETTQENKDNSYSLFSMTSGEKIISYTYDKFDVLFLDENEKRYFGFYSRNAPKSSDAQIELNSESLGVVSYASHKTPIRKIKIDVQEAYWLEVLDVSNPVIELLPIKDNAISLNSGKTLYFTSTDGVKDEGVNFDIQIAFYTTDTYKPVSFMVQVRNNRLQFSEDFSSGIFHLEYID